MNFKFISMLLVLVLSVMCGKVFSQQCESKVTIVTDETDAKIFLDDRLIGKGKAEVEVEKGKYYLEAAEPSASWNPKRIKDTLVIDDCNKIELSYSFNSSVYLKTNPNDVYVYNNDTLVGYTPLFISRKFEKITLSKPGYDSKTISLSDFSKNTIDLRYIGETQNESFYEKPIFKILIGGIVALGGATAYFKLKADDKYQKYQSTANPEYLDQTEKYDLISGITMGALQINFGVLIYYFLSD